MSSALSEMPSSPTPKPKWWRPFSKSPHPSSSLDPYAAAIPFAVDPVSSALSSPPPPPPHHHDHHPARLLHLPDRDKGKGKAPLKGAPTTSSTHSDHRHPTTTTTPRGVSGSVVFGARLQDSSRLASVAISMIGPDKRPYIYGFIPVVVAKCGLYLKENATATQGIFRISGSTKRMRELQAVFDTPPLYGKDLDWRWTAPTPCGPLPTPPPLEANKPYYSVHDAANVLRRFLLALPEPLIPYTMYKDFRAVLTKHTDTQRQVQHFRALISTLPDRSQHLLLYLLDLLAVFARQSDSNLMTASNLAVVFQPGLCSPPPPPTPKPGDAATGKEEQEAIVKEVKDAQHVLEFLIDHQQAFVMSLGPNAPQAPSNRPLPASISSCTTSTTNPPPDASTASTASSVPPAPTTTTTTTMSSTPLRQVRVIVPPSFSTTSSDEDDRHLRGGGGVDLARRASERSEQSRRRKIKKDRKESVPSSSVETGHILGVLSTVGGSSRNHNNQQNQGVGVSSSLTPLPSSLKRSRTLPISPFRGGGHAKNVPSSTTNGGVSSAVAPTPAPTPGTGTEGEDESKVKKQTNQVNDQDEEPDSQTSRRYQTDPTDPPTRTSVSSPQPQPCPAPTPAPTPGVVVTTSGEKINSSTPSFRDRFKVPNWTTHSSTGTTSSTLRLPTTTGACGGATASGTTRTFRRRSHDDASSRQRHTSTSTSTTTPKESRKLKSTTTISSPRHRTPVKSGPIDPSTIPTPTGTTSVSLLSPQPLDQWRQSKSLDLER